jgi:type III restriction enzyme
VFREGVFASARKDQSRVYTFTKHFTGPDQVPAFDGNEDGDEVNCARQLDSLPDAVLEHWVRNVSQHPDAFWLPRADSRFYPDFVAKLTDGRLMVIEYKGAHLSTGDETREKVAVGLKWEEAMNGEGIFLLVEKEVNGRTPREQMLDRIHRSSTPNG